MWNNKESHASRRLAWDPNSNRDVIQVDLSGRWKAFIFRIIHENTRFLKEGRYNLQYLAVWLIVQCVLVFVFFTWCGEIFIYLTKRSVAWYPLTSIFPSMIPSSSIHPKHFWDNLLSLTLRTLNRESHVNFISRFEDDNFCYDQRYWY